MNAEYLFLGSTFLLFVALVFALTALASTSKRAADVDAAIAAVHAEVAKAQESATADITAAARRRLKHATQFISAYLDPYFGLPPHQIEDRLVGVIQEARLRDEPATLADLAEGLSLLVRVTPQIAMHTRNYTLLGHLWARADLGSFVYMCGRLALAVPGQEDMVTRWRENQMTWNPLLEDLDTLGLRDGLGPRSQPEGAREAAPPPVG
jgi:hypothetical protein